MYGGAYSASLGGRVLQTLIDAGKVASYAAYGQATYMLTPSTGITAGARYTIEHRSVSARGERLYDNAPFVRPIPGLPLISEEPFENSTTFREPTWRLSLDHHFNEMIMAYASASRGFQSGGWNLQTPQAPPFDPERLTAYEVGAKFVDRSGRYRADAAAFHYDYADMQVSVFTPIGSATTNATSAGLHGASVQLDARLNESTDVSIGAQLLHSKFNDFETATCTDYSQTSATYFPPISCNASGNRLPFAPKLKINLGGTHHTNLGRAGSLLFSGNLAYNSGYFSEPDNVVRQTAFTTVDAIIEWIPLSGPSLRLWALNLTDTHYYDSLSVFPTVSVLYRPAAPRRVGLSVIYAF
jgi:outer membrane receptor protein involved in Fe transport